MSERGDQVQKMLALLSKHSDLVAEAFDGEVSGGSRQRNKAIEALFEIGAIKPYDEDTYRLNPRLREFMADYFASYNAYQALRSVTGTMRQAREQWSELRRLREVGSSRNADRLFAALDESIVDIAYNIEHNLHMLHVLIGNQYGNVEGLDAKLRQNKYYLAQVVSFLRDMEYIQAFVETVQEQAIASGITDVRVLISRRLGARLITWTGQIKDAQASITKRLFDARLMEKRLKHLSNFALWLDRHRTSQGWELNVPDPENIDVSLLIPERIKVRTQPDVADSDNLVSEGLLRVLATLPPPRAERPVQPPSLPQRLIDEDEVGPQEDAAAPHVQALYALVEEIVASDKPLSILAWKEGREDLVDIQDGAWLMYCHTQLQSAGFTVEILSSPLTALFAVNEPFHDIQVRQSQPRLIP